MGIVEALQAHAALVEERLSSIHIIRVVSPADHVMIVPAGARPPIVLDLVEIQLLLVDAEGNWAGARASVSWRPPWPWR